jgi:hypothetical protein
MNIEQARGCVAGGCGEQADVLVHWACSGEADPMCLGHATVVLQLADSATALMNGTWTESG